MAQKMDNDPLTQSIIQQQELLLKIARQIIPNITREDIMQPNDFDQLEYNPIFRYEEGYLAGLLAAQAEIKAYQKEKAHP